MVLVPEGRNIYNKITPSGSLKPRRGETTQFGFDKYRNKKYWVLIGPLKRLDDAFPTNIQPHWLKTPRKELGIVNRVFTEGKNQTYFLLCTQNREEPKI